MVLHRPVELAPFIRNWNGRFLKNARIDLASQFGVKDRNVLGPLGYNRPKNRLEQIDLWLSNERPRTPFLCAFSFYSTCSNPFEVLVSNPDPIPAL